MITDAELIALSADCNNPAPLRKKRPDLSIPYIIEANKRLNLNLLPKRTAGAHTAGVACPKAEIPQSKKKGAKE